MNEGSVPKTSKSTKFGFLNGSTKPFQIVEFVLKSIFATEPLDEIDR